MSTFDAILIILGGIFAALLILFLGIPLTVGSLEWWTNFLRTLYKLRKPRVEPKDSIGE